jgi:hypothetical protein
VISRGELVEICESEKDAIQIIKNKGLLNNHNIGTPLVKEKRKVNFGLRRSVK